MTAMAVRKDTRISPGERKECTQHPCYKNYLQLSADVQSAALLYREVLWKVRAT